MDARHTALLFTLIRGCLVQCLVQCDAMLVCIAMLNGSVPVRELNHQVTKARGTQNQWKIHRSRNWHLWKVVGA
jgi:hypothetical protein